MEEAEAAARLHVRVFGNWSREARRIRRQWLCCLTAFENFLTGRGLQHKRKDAAAVRVQAVRREVAEIQGVDFREGRADAGGKPDLLVVSIHDLVLAQYEGRS